MGLVSTDDLSARGIETASEAQAQAAIDDASSAVRAYVAPVLDGVDRGGSPDVPDAVVMVVCGMIRRAVTNPLGLTMETLGDYTYQANVNTATLLPTARERRVLRGAAARFARENGMDVPAFGSGSVAMRTEVPWI